MSILSGAERKKMRDKEEGSRMRDEKNQMMEEKKARRLDNIASLKTEEVTLVP